jgi:hypothetical protein
MSLLSRLDAKFGRYAPSNVTIGLIVGQVFTFVATQVNSDKNAFDIWDRLQLYPEKVLAGEWWRVITFLFSPPGDNVIFAFLFWYMFYLMGSTLEATWGAFRYNMYLFIGYVAAVAAAFGAYFIVAPAGGAMPATNLFLEGTIFFAFARLYPDFTIYIFFVLPVKIRWLALLQWLFYGWSFTFGSVMERCMILAAIANYLVFFGFEIWGDAKQGHRRMKFQSRALRSPTKMVHTCRVCGITSEAAPQLQFRYCSKCEGECCYCPEHVRNHEHVVAQPAETAS